MNMDVQSVQSTVQSNLDLFRSIRKLTASEGASIARPAFGGDSDLAEDLAYEAARLIRSESSLAQRSHVLSYRAHAGLLEELA